jgi:hypothetical protein
MASVYVKMGKKYDQTNKAQRNDENFVGKRHSVV